jgi:hypothetical protein
MNRNDFRIACRIGFRTGGHKITKADVAAVSPLLMYQTRVICHDCGGGQEKSSRQFISEKQRLFESLVKSSTLQNKPAIVNSPA